MAQISIKKTVTPNNPSTGKLALFFDNSGNLCKVDEAGLIKIIATADQITHPLWENDTYSDWYLPSEDEMQMISDNLMDEGIGGFVIESAYWTSTENNATDGIVLSNALGSYNRPKSELYPIRPVRSFNSSKEYSLRDVGPAGGYIFYIDNTDPEAPVYYEAAPEDLADAAWSDIDSILLGGTSSDIGTGLANSELIIAQIGHAASAAKDCLDFTVVFDDRIRPKNGKLVRREYIDGIDVVVTTHSELVALRDASELIVGQNYLISDFAQSYNIFDGSTMDIVEEQIGAAEPIIVTASKVNELYKVAISTVYPEDVIYYSLDILDIRDIGFGNGVDTINANFKGMIYYRKDTVQNVECHYDFRNIKFRRWAVDAVAYDGGAAYVANNVCKSTVDGKIYKCITATTGEGDPTVNTDDWVLWLDITADAFVSWTSDKTQFNIGNIATDNLIINNTTAGVDYADFYTFSDYYNWVKNVSIGMIDLEYAIGDWSYATQLNNIVCKTIDDYYTCFSNEISSNNWNNTIGNNFYSNTIGNDFYYNTIGNSFRSNTIGNSFSSNTIGNSFNSNTIGNSFYNNTIVNYFSTNTIGNGFNTNTIGNSFNSNTIGNNFYSNTIGNNFKYNVIGNSFNNNAIGNEFSYNTIVNYLYKTIFGDNCQYNTISNKINGTTTAKTITFGDSITMCTIQDFAFGVLAADLDLSIATHIRGAYNTTIYQDAVDGVKLSYMTGGVLTIADVTD